jgi:hypothetical protein
MSRMREKSQAQTDVAAVRGIVDVIRGRIRDGIEYR